VRRLRSGGRNEDADGKEERATHTLAVLAALAERANPINGEQHQRDADKALRELDIVEWGEDWTEDWLSSRGFGMRTRDCVIRARRVVIDMLEALRWAT
jgi:hypothetical protein